MGEITGNLKRDVKDLLGESASLVTGFFKRGLCTVRAVADKWKAFARDISTAVDTLMQPPFAEGGPEAPAPSLDAGAEPVVTVMESGDQHFPVGKQMPLSQANEYVGRMDAEYMEQDLAVQPVRVSIDYTRNGRTDRYILPLQIGAGGSLLEQMEGLLDTYRDAPERVTALFDKVPEEYRQQFEAAFTPLVHDSIGDLTQNILPYFQQHCAVSELEQQLQAQAAVLPEGQKAAFAETAKTAVLGLRRAANGAPPLEPAPKREQPAQATPQVQSRPAERRERSTGAARPRKSVKVSLRQIKAEKDAVAAPQKGKTAPQRGGR